MKTSRISRRTLLAAGLALAGTRLQAAPDETVETFDVVVVGGGIGGLSAALSAAERNAKVVLLEKNGFLGGDTLISGGTFNAVDPERQRPLGIVDSFELFEKQMLESGRGYNDPKVVHVLARESTSALHWFESYGMRFLPEVTEIYGSGYVRSHRPAYPRGRGYIHCLSNACFTKGVDVRLGARAQVLLRGVEGRVVGIRAATKNGAVVFRARKGVILASGGFAANRELLRRYAPAYASLPIDSLSSSTGDMLTAAMEIGADAVNLEFVECVPGAPPGIEYQVRLDYNAEDCIMVNAEGRRFTKETGTRRDIAVAVAGEKGPCYEIADQGAVDRMNPINRKNLWRGYFAKVAAKDETPEGLAERLGLPKTALAKEVREAVSNGRFAKPPFWGVRIHLRIHCTLGGLRIDEKARVIDKNGQPIPGLRATGALAGNIHGINRLGANGLNCACVFGRIAGAEAARGV